MSEVKITGIDIHSNAQAWADGNLACATIKFSARGFEVRGAKLIERADGTYFISMPKSEKTEQRSVVMFDTGLKEEVARAAVLKYEALSE